MIGKTSRSWVDDVVVNSTLISSRLDWVSTEDGRYGIDNLIEINGSVGTEESIGHGAVLEEPTCDSQVELTIREASIYEEKKWKYAFGVCAKITG